MLGLNNNGINNNSHTKLLLHCDETGSPPATADSSDSAHTIQNAGTFTADTTNKKFGAASLVFTVNDYKYISDSDDWYVNRDFTIDLWVKNTVTANAPVYNQQPSDGSLATSSIYFRVSSTGSIRALISNGSAWGWNVESTATTANDGNWHHIALVMKGDRVTLYLDGIADGTDTDTGSVPDSVDVLKIGNNYAGSEDYIGNIDEYRITKGEALWQRNFKVPNRAS